MGEAGEDGPVIAILGEYDALPGLSQEAGVAEQKPLPGAGLRPWLRPQPAGLGLAARGHGGEGLPGSATASRAACATTAARPRKAAPPKASWSAPAPSATSISRSPGIPASFSGVNPANSLANTRIDFAFNGRASHAAASPHLGRSALDAVELMSVGVNYMREHMPSDARVHSAILDAGGVAPNVVQAFAKVRYLIRARDPAGTVPPDRAGAQDRRRRRADDGDPRQRPGDQRRVQPARQHAAGAGDAGQSRPARAAAVRRRRQGSRRRNSRRRCPRRTSRAAYRRAGMPAKSGHPAVRCDRPARCAAPPAVSARPMWATSAGWCRPVQARGATYAIGTPGPFLAADRAGQDAGRAQGAGACGQGDGRHRAGRDPGRDAARPRQSGPPGARRPDALCLPAAGRTRPTDQDVGLIRRTGRHRALAQAVGAGSVGRAHAVANPPTGRASTYITSAASCAGQGKSTRTRASHPAGHAGRPAQPPAPPGQKARGA